MICNQKNEKLPAWASGNSGLRPLFATRLLKQTLPARLEGRRSGEVRMGRTDSCLQGVVVTYLGEGVCALCDITNA